jgi:hypothetical protein
MGYPHELGSMVGRSNPVNCRKILALGLGVLAGARATAGCADLAAENAGVVGALCGYDCGALSRKYFPTDGATRCFLFGADSDGQDEWPAEMMSMRTQPDFTPAEGATCDGVPVSSTPQAEALCAAQNLSFTAATGAWCSDGILTHKFCEPTHFALSA